MKQFIAILLSLSIATPTFADCDFSRDVVKTEKGYTYSVDCHIEVGKQIQANKARTEQVDKLTKSLEMKDLVIDKAEQRIQNYRETVTKMDDRLNTIDKMQSDNKVLYFIIGVAFTSLAVWGAGHLR